MKKQGMLADCGWFVLLLGTLLLALGASWQLWSTVDYGYRWWYDVLEIESHIDHYGPQNRYKQGLELLSRDQHEALFADIVQAVHQHGEGLADINYTVIYGDAIKNIALLREPEVVHLQDVADLIDRLQWLLWCLLPVVAVLLMMVWRGRWSLRWRRQLVLLAVVLGSVTASVLLIGPTKVFYQFHVWIFPAEHQWFFYYQESLMTTLMHAPQLFGVIAVAIIALALLLYGLLLLALRYTIRSQQGS